MAQQSADQSMWTGERKGQSVTEAALFFLAVVLALVAMSPYVRRAVQANLKLLEDHINAEACPQGQTSC